MGVDDGTTADPFVPAGADGRPATPVLGPTTTPWVLDLIRRFRAAGPSVRVCTHVAEDPDQGAVWHATVPDLRSCRREGCAAAVRGVLDARLGRPSRDGPPRCTTCGRTGVVVRGVGVAVGATMLRGTVCETCLAALPVPTPSSATDPLEPAPADARGPRRIELDDEPLDDDPQELATAEGPAALDAVGRRALRRGWLLAEACGRSTPPGLDPDRAVVGGLLARAAKLARGLAGPAAADGAFVHDLAFRSLVETTTTAWWLLRLDDAERRTATTAFRERDASGPPADEARDRLTALGRRADAAILLGAAPDAAAGSWRELAALHLTRGPGGFAVDPGRRDPDPSRLLVAGEHLSLACADYVVRTAVDLDPDELRRLADEVTELRRRVEAGLRDAR